MLRLLLLLIVWGHNGSTSGSTVQHASDSLRLKQVADESNQHLSLVDSNNDSTDKQVVDANTSDVLDGLDQEQKDHIRVEAIFKIDIE